MIQAASILGVFGQSPIGPLQKHMEQCYVCAKKLTEFFQQVLVGDWKKAELLQQEIIDLEEVADLLKKELRLHLPSNLFLTLPRSDLLQLLHQQDEVANGARDIAGIVISRQMQIPSSLSAQLFQYVNRSVDACSQAYRAIAELDELAEAGFDGKEISSVEEMIDQLDDIEEDTDLMQRQLRHALFLLEKELPPVEVMFLYKLIELIGELANRAKRVGSRLQLLLAR